jgi:hypothetical protein
MVERYLSSMSWPVRASLLRAEAVSAGIEGWLSAGDPPYLGGIAASAVVPRAERS